MKTVGQGAFAKLESYEESIMRLYGEHNPSPQPPLASMFEWPQSHIDGIQLYFSLQGLRRKETQNLSHGLPRFWNIIRPWIMNLKAKMNQSIQSLCANHSAKTNKKYLDLYTSRQMIER